ncbi:hypothetical protein LB505_001508 [Fusarium chuoi]|nr:hypothetical protein LB505_001508 [Fusarium chuoi]
MESMGFICQHGANVADYLTGVTVPTERQIHPDHQNRFPRTADALRAEYEKSPIYERMKSEYDYPTSAIADERTKQFKLGPHDGRVHLTGQGLCKASVPDCPRRQAYLLDQAAFHDRTGFDRWLSLL